MIIFYTNLAKYEIFEMSTLLVELSLGHCYDQFRTKYVVHLTFFRNIVNKLQSIDCENDHFSCHFGKI